MTAPTLPSAPPRHAAARALLATWLVTAAWDFVCASGLAVLAYASTVARLWRGVAATALGPRAVEMGAWGVAAGVGLHLVVSLAWSALFVVAAVRWDALRRALARPAGALLVAAACGPAIWLAMSLVVIPLATGRPPSFGARWWVQLLVHVPFVSIPLVFTARQALGLAAGTRDARDVRAAYLAG